MAIRHTKTNTIPDPTQAELDAQIALGNYPLGTLLSDIALASDWNADHTSPDIADVTGLQTALDAKAPIANPTFTGIVQATTLQADTSAGLVIESDSGNDVALFGAGGGSNATFYGGVNINGATVITSASAAAFAVGANGATNPALLVDSSAASAANGIGVIASAASSGVILSSISSSADEGLTLTSKGASELILNSGTLGTNSIRLRSGGSNRIILNSSSFTFANTQQYAFTPTSSSTAATIRYSYISVTETNLTAGVEAPNIVYNLANGRSHASNTAITLQRDFRINGTSHSFANAGGVVSDLGALALVHGTGGTNATITNNSALLIQSNTVANTTNGYGINVSAPTGATNNYAARINGAIDLDGAGAGTSGQVLTSGGAGASCTWTTPSGGGGGITRSILTVNTNTTAGGTASTDYVYLCSGTMDLTLPAASGNTNKYDIKNTGTGVITIIGTVDGGVNPTLTTQYESITLVSNGTDWSII